MNMFAMSDDLQSSEKVLNAASFGQVDTLKSALDDGGNPDYVRLDVSPTLIATTRDYIDCLRVLVENSARSDVKNRSGWTALHEASKKEDMEALNVILSNLNKTDLEVKDKNGSTALMVALENALFDNADALVSKKTDLLFLSNNEGNDVLLWSAKNKNLECLKWCVKNIFSDKNNFEYDFKKINKDGESLLDLISIEWQEGYDILNNHIKEIFKVDLSNYVKFTGSLKREKLKVDDNLKTEDKEDKDDIKQSNPFGLGGIKKRSL